MAGKSPDRSEQHRSSGETKGKAETVPEQVGDPRAVLCESPGAAGTEGEAVGGGKPSANGSAAGKTAAEAGGEGRKAEGERGDGTEGGDDTDGSDRGAGPDRADGAEDPGGAAEESGAASEAGTAASDGEEAGDGGGEAGPEEPGSEGSSDQATAVFRVPGSRTADGAVGAGSAEAGEAGEDVRDEAGDSAEEGRSKEDEGAESGEGAEDAADRDGKEAGAGTPADQTIAVFRVRPGTGAKRPERAGDEPGDELGDEAGKPGDATEEEAAGEPGRAGRPEEETDAERTSRFVPLRSDDIPLAPGSTAPSAPQTPPGLPEHELTRQQPLPTAQRPLDLLAELTNKPAPPETPLRVA
ncbi:MAG TPA: hypothetical protein VFY14_21405, partial [Streptomyces sp.]|nr:hypothetical protein [Streptomyces sp.]